MILLISTVQFLGSTILFCFVEILKELFNTIFTHFYVLFVITVFNLTFVKLYFYVNQLRENIKRIRLREIAFEKLDVHDLKS